ncbi:helix-turn-helix domain-containing protein [Micromonospora siamensis]|uniref:Helix-turn-helix domain-containing protein n=1 Tax=Micromonospora siamensis TaxID=299152 RepID=A0A1C5IRE6_9ACTN|nr:helix-turn-helix transcriptional regulator [Micromonospora siamensis]SCG60713.1 Helix-turn-helix domain-containing protein [Micromonospora siamensis]
MDDFGTELRRRREAAGLSLTDLAQRVRYSKSHLSKVESGAKRPSDALARGCDVALAAGGALTRLVSGRPGRRVSSPPGVKAWAVAMDGVGPADAAAFDPSSVSAFALAGLTGAERVRSGDRTGEALAALPLLRSWFAELRRLGQTSRPAALGPMLVSTTAFLRDLAQDSRAPARQQAFRLAARVAEYTGWMAQERGNGAAALWWTDHAVELGVAGGNDELRAYALVRRAELCLYQDDALGAAQLAQEARAARCGRRTRGLAAQREAQAYALTGDEAGCRRALAEAADLLTDLPADDDEPQLGSTTAPDPMRFATAWCLHDLGHLDESAEILHAELERLPATAQRARARYASRLALSLAGLRQLDRAAEVVGPALDVVRSVDSATARYDLGQLNRVVRRWRDDATVRQLMPRLTAALRVTPASPTELAS